MIKYHGVTIALGTLHGKESAIAPPFRAALAATVIAVAVETDSLGTFSGEIERPGSMIEVARRKARLAIAASGIPRALASEGSFGPHPASPFLASSQELLLFLDDEAGVELSEMITTTSTNFTHATVEDLAGAERFLRRAGFPSHAVIVRPEPWDSARWLVKGVRDRAGLANAFDEARVRSTAGRVRLETDMRAHLNPTRMGSIGEVAERLAQKLATPCPRCAAPGWGPGDVERGLPCEDCGEPTTWVLQEIHRCAACGHQASEPRSDHRKTAPAAVCGGCNP